MKNYLTQAVVIAGVMFSVVTPSFAENFEIDSANNDSNVTITVTADSVGGTLPTSTISESTTAGIYNGYLGSAAVGSGAAGTSNITVFCVDPINDIAWNGGYAANTGYSVAAPAGAALGTNPNYYGGGLASQLVNAGVSAGTAQTESVEIAYLCNQYLNPGVTTTLAGNASDAQIAIWDIFTDGGGDFTGTGANTAFGAGNDFQISSYDSNQISVADIELDETAALTFADNNPATSLTNIAWIQSPEPPTSSQNFAYYSAVPPTNQGITVVPEPSLPAFLISLALASGIMVIAKRRSSMIA